MTPIQDLPPIAWSWAGRPAPGESVSGDEHLVERVPAGVRIAVLDGLGHGREAALAARRTIDTLRFDGKSDAPTQIRRCHAALENTRGVVMSLALISAAGMLTWLGVGNVQGIVVRPERCEPLLVRAGMVGHRLPRLEVYRTELSPGDRIVVATDGVDPDFASALDCDTPVDEQADALLGAFGAETDDALVVVACYEGS